MLLASNSEILMARLSKAGLISIPTGKFGVVSTVKPTELSVAFRSQTLTVSS
jgi:hypothetical protein